MLWGVNGKAEFLKHEGVLEKVLPLVEEILGEGYKMEFNGALLSLPG